MMKEYDVKYYTSRTGETLAFREGENNGPVLLLIHGNMSSSVHFQPLMEKLERTYKVYALDLPGFGDSSYNRELNSLKDFSRDVEAFILDKELSNIHLLGWSTGGGIILETAAALPERIEKAYLLNSVGLKGYSMYKKGDDFQPILTERIYKREDIEQDPVQVLPVLEAYKTGNRALIKMIWESSIYNLNCPPEEEYEIFIDAVMKQRNLVDVDVALTQFNITHESNGVVEGSGLIEKIKCPVIIIHGEKDMVVPVQEAYEAKEILKEQAQLEIIEDAGHSIITDNIDKLAGTIRRYLTH